MDAVTVHSRAATSWLVARLLLGATTLLCCGGRAEAPAGPDGGAPLFDAASDENAFRGCVSSSGYAICGGPRGCFPPSSQGAGTDCWDCSADHLGSRGFDAALCLNAAEPTIEWSTCDDGQIYVEAQIPNGWNPAAFEVGQLFASNGLADRVRYADWSAWDGSVLPAPTTCPQFMGWSICGGTCNPCAAGELCTGRSPGHPYSVCVPSPVSSCASPNWSCPAGDGCLLFQVDSVDQPVADANGICVPLSTCQAAATQLPGGAICHG